MAGQRQARVGGRPFGAFQRGAAAASAIRGWSASFLILGVVLFALPIASAQELEKDVVYRAMRDEMQRSMDRLQMEDLQRPYYLEYTVRESESASASASFGGLRSTRESRSRRLTTDLRVGDYVFDTTNFRRGGSPTRLTSLALDDDYEALRHAIWLVTDRAYKSAVETLARKQAVVKTRNLQEQPDDFSRAEPNEYIGEPIQLSVDRTKWEGTVKRLSAIFKEFPVLQDSSVYWSASARNQYFINSEGFHHRWGRGRVSLSANAMTQAKDGMRLSEGFTLRATLEKGLPSEEEIGEKIRELANELTARAGSPAPDDYTGPVLFVGSGAGQFFDQLFVDNLENPRTPLFSSEGAARRFVGPRLVKRLGKRVLPRSFDVVDDPTIDEWEGNLLFGNYPVDDEGMTPQKVSLVEGGKLKTLLMSRTPTEKLSGSNGHGRGIGSSVGSASNVFVTPKETLSEDDLIQALLGLCKEEELEYGLIVKKIGRGGRGGLGDPVAAYRVYVEDGRQEPTRGLTFEGVTVSALRDIEAAGESKHVYHFGGGTGTVIAPSVLIDEMELRKPPPQQEKGTYMPHPAFDG